MHDKPDLQISYSWATCRSLAINGTFIARGVEIERHIMYYIDRNMQEYCL